ncbi:Peroxidase 57 [Glycine soja]|nr:Peroxidase 57 [Glycine soja]
MAEKDSGTNDSVRGYNLIDEAKKTLEATCPSLWIRKVLLFFEFYKEILAKKGLLQIDQQLALDAGTKGFVLDFASNGDKFQKGFANAIVKMGEIDVLVGNQGEIRKKCSVFNRN